MEDRGISTLLLLVVRHDALVPLSTHSKYEYRPQGANTTRVDGRISPTDLYASRNVLGPMFYIPSTSPGSTHTHGHPRTSPNFNPTAQLPETRSEHNIMLSTISRTINETSPVNPTTKSTPPHPYRFDSAEILGHVLPAPKEFCKRQEPREGRLRALVLVGDDARGGLVEERLHLEVLAGVGERYSHAAAFRATHVLRGDRADRPVPLALEVCEKSMQQPEGLGWQGGSKGRASRVD